MKTVTTQAKTATSRLAAAKAEAAANKIEIEESNAHKNRLRVLRKTTNRIEFFTALANYLATPRYVKVVPLAFDKKTGTPTEVKRVLDNRSLPKSVSLTCYGNATDIVPKKSRKGLLKFLAANETQGSVVVQLSGCATSVVLTRDYQLLGGGHNDSPTYGYVWNARLPAVLEL